jgi:hypothetical protein
MEDQKFNTQHLKGNFSAPLRALRETPLWFWRCQVRKSSMSGSLVVSSQSRSHSVKTLGEPALFFKAFSLGCNLPVEEVTGQVQL